MTYDLLIKICKTMPILKVIVAIATNAVPIKK